VDQRRHLGPPAELEPARATEGRRARHGMRVRQLAVRAILAIMLGLAFSSAVVHIAYAYDGARPHSATLIRLDTRPGVARRNPPTGLCRSAHFTVSQLCRRSRW
jgi:hypothetical protein